VDKANRLLRINNLIQKTNPNKANSDPVFAPFETETASKVRRELKQTHIRAIAPASPEILPARSLRNLSQLWAKPQAV